MLFSRYVDQALQTIQNEDTRQWAQFVFVPCPVGSPKTSNCTADPGYGIGPNCCIHDKYEACMVQEFGCLHNSTACDMNLRAKMAKFLHCFEGQVIKEETCDADAEQCFSIANLDARFPAVDACVKDDKKSAAASDTMAAICTKQKPNGWPTVVVDGVTLCGDDSCFMPLLKPLCAAYKGTPKPNSCKKAGFV